MIAIEDMSALSPSSLIKFKQKINGDDVRYEYEEGNNGEEDIDNNSSMNEHYDSQSQSSASSNSSNDSRDLLHTKRLLDFKQIPQSL